MSTLTERVKWQGSTTLGLPCVVQREEAGGSSVMLSSEAPASHWMEGNGGDRGTPTGGVLLQSTVLPQIIVW